MGRHHKTIWIWASNSGIVDLGDRILIFDTTLSPDNKCLVTSSCDGSICLWDVAIGKELHRFPGHPDGAFGAAFSPDGKYILTASEDNTARLWQIDLDATLREVCALLTRDLTSEERIQFNISNEGPTCPAQ